MKIRYQAPTYSPALVTGRYVLCEGKRGAYRFIIFENATGHSGRMKGKPGKGYPLREYETDGAELPAALRDLCIESQTMQLWR